MKEFVHELKLFAFAWLIVFSPFCVAQERSDNVGSDHKRDVAPASGSALVHVCDSAKFATWLSTRAEIRVSRAAKHLWQLTGDDGLQKMLESAPGVRYIDKGRRRASPETVLGSFDITANGVVAARSSYPLITGTDLSVSIKEKPFDADDIDLRGRVKVNRHFDEPGTLHASIMATIAAGAGNSSSYAEGVAPGALVTSSDYDNLLPDPGVELTSEGVTVQNHSYGVGIENYYGIESREYDQSVIDFPKILHVFSSGNSGDQTAPDGRYSGLAAVANITGQFKTAKNVLTVGSVDALNRLAVRSSRGPAYDGRIKPEVVGYGDAGASESAALISGAALLIQDAHKKMTGTLPDAALVRCILINTAEDVGRTGIDYQCGFGSVNVKYALETVQQGNFIEGTLESHGAKVFEVEVPAGAMNLKATLSWDDPAAAPFNNHALVNDLDLTIETPGGTQLRPWILNPGGSISELEAEAVRGTDTLNNNEQVSLSNAAPGMYRFVVTSKELATSVQKFFISFDMGRGFEWQHPVQGSFMVPNGKNVLRWSGDLSGPASLQYRRLDSEEWTVLGDVELSHRLYEWVSPDLTGNIMFRIVLPDGQHLSASVPLSGSAALSVDFNCDEEFMLSWKRDAGATAYQLLQLGDRYLQPFITTTDTFAIISKNPVAGNAFAVVNLYGENTGMHGATVGISSQGVGCYFMTAIARADIASPVAVIDVELGTLYNISSVSLEWKVGERWDVVQTITSLPAENFSLVHHAPGFDENVYRVTLTLNDGRKILSELISVLIAGENSFFVYPNPSRTGDELNAIINSEDEVLMQLRDVNGKTIRRARDFGAVKVFDTAGLASGMYVLEVYKPDGRVLVRKIFLR